jgi:hypothetical protein
MAHSGYYGGRGPAFFHERKAQGLHMIDYAMTEGERPRKRIDSMWGRW